MMLPRANKNTLKVLINRDDNEEDFEVRKELAKLNMKKGRSENTNEMDVENSNQRRRIDGLVSQCEAGKSEGCRKSMSMNMAGRTPLEYQDENNQKSRHSNFLANKEAKPAELKTQLAKQNSQELQENNKGGGLPRTENSASNFLSQQLRAQAEQRMGKDLEQMKQEFFNEHLQVIREESYMVKEEGEQCDRAIRSAHIDLADYMGGVQRKIERKMELLMDLQRKTTYLAFRLSQPKLFEENPSSDEQLLEELPPEDFGGRLF
jgi:hypothetical protein